MWFAGLSFAVDSPDLLQPDHAFKLEYKLKKTDELLLSWDIAEGYYLYRHKFKIVSLTPGIEIGEQRFPTGHSKRDQFYGEVETFRNHIDAEIVLLSQDTKINQFVLEVTFQGCADAGVCYMPIQKIISLSKEDSNWLGILSDSENLSERITASLAGRSIGLILPGFLVLGILLAFTPCVFPMIPILSGIIAGQNEPVTPRRAFMLSLTYVMASAMTYTIFGILAGLFGSNLQALFQEPRVIVFFSAIFVLLALSMFDAFHLQLPSYIRNKIFTIAPQNGNMLGAALMGMFSTLTIGPCITAPLAGTLIYIGRTGDAALGGLALFSLGLGMGIPLLIIGTSAGKLLPKTGKWMNVMKAFFGMGLLAVAVWLLGRVMQPMVIQLLWGALLLIPPMYLGWKKIWKGAGLIASIYAVLFMIGITTHPQSDMMRFLCVAAAACEERSTLPFVKIKSIDELQQVLAGADGRWVMLDFYADWCVACKEMELYTFSEPDVQSALSPVLLAQADVTQNSKADQALLKKFNLIGPPAILFFGPDQKEHASYRILGYMKAEKFLDRLNQIIHRDR